MKNFQKTQAIIQAEEPYKAKSNRINYFDLVIETAEGATLTDVDGNQYIDLLASASATNVGSHHPQVVEAIRHQLDKMVHYTPAYFYHELMGPLAQRLTEITPGDFDKRVTFGTTGSDAVDALIKFSRAYTRRTHIIVFQGAYHGATYASMTASSVSLNMHRKMGPLLPDIHYLPFPDLYRKRADQTDDAVGIQALDAIREALRTYIPADEVAAFIVEPIQGDAGIKLPPANFMKGLYELSREIGALFTVDEINQGLGRAGKWMSIEHFDIEPDLIALGKSLASGMPLSAVVGRSEIMQVLDPPAHAFTNAGNVLCCAAALATLDVIESEGLLNRSLELGAYAKERFEAMQRQFSCIGDVRMLGLNGGIEIVKDPLTKEADPIATTQIITYLFEHGVLMITLAGNVLRFQPPLIITQRELDQALAIIEQAFQAHQNGELPLPATGQIGWS